MSLYSSGGSPRLSPGLTYSSHQGNADYQPNYGFGIDWISTYTRRLNGASPDVPTVLSVTRPNGRNIEFTQQADTVTYLADAATNMRLVRLKNTAGVTTGWRLKAEDIGAIEVYDADGLLVSLNGLQGKVQTFTNDTSWRLASASDGWGRSIALGYSIENRVASITLPDTNVITLSYDGSNNLVSIGFPGATSKQFHYEDARFPHALTGITDENGYRYATYVYDAAGKAISSAHTGDLARHQLAYGVDSTVVTDPLGTQRTYSFTTVLGVARNTGASQPGGSGCGPSSSAVTYDANGNIESRTDFAGHKSCYAYDLTRNLETKRVEGLAAGSDCAAALGSPPAPTEANPVRVISTVWHPDWRLPVQRAEPRKITTWIYNGQPDPTAGGAIASCAPMDALLPDGKPIAVLCRKVEQATTDTTGASGFAATITGSPRIRTWTYTRYGQVLTAGGPRTDVSDITSYTYYDAGDTDIGKRGNLATVTNALGHVTRYTAYDLNGRPLTVVDTNGNPVTLTYTPRGWLDSVTIGGQTTRYTYDPVGQLTRITRPDGGYTGYGYDAAHRLMSISDTRGDVLSYSRDNAGDITRTDWLNPDGSLARSRRFAYDALGRLQNVIDSRNGVDAVTTYGYDANGHRTFADDAKSQRTATTRDSLDRAIQVTDPMQGLTRLIYDGRDRLAQLIAANNAQTSFTVDGLGNVTQEVSADRGSRSATYDAAGNLLTVTDARGITTTYTYDALDRPLTVSYPQTGENLVYTWDSGSGCTHGVGRLCRVTDAGGSASFAYDQRGNLVAETRIEGGVTLPTTQYVYDAADRLTTTIAPSNAILTSTLDIDGRVEQVAASLQGVQKTVVSGIQYDAAGSVTAQTLGNGTVQTRSFHTDGRLATQAAVPSRPAWFNSSGPRFDYAALVAAVPELAGQGLAWHAVPDDVDHDGDQDLFLYFNSANEEFVDLACQYDCGNYTGPDFGVLVYLENVVGSYVRRPFSNGEDLVAGDIEQMVPLDYDNDGRIDLLMVMNDASNPYFYSGKPYRRLRLFRNDPGPAYVTTGNPNGIHFSDVTVATGLNKADWTAEGLVLDINQDGYPDILGIARDAAGNVLGDAFIFSPAAGTYQPVTTTGLSRPLWGAAIADLDGDGRFDVVAEDGSNGPRFFRNAGGGNFTEWSNTQNLSGLAGRWWVKFIPADMDNDGRMDLVTFETDIAPGGPYGVVYAGGRIRWLRNLGVSGNQITVAEQTSPAFDSDGEYQEVAYGGTVGDADNDGNLDILMATRNKGSRLVVADGLGGFRRPEDSGEIVGLSAPDSRFANPVMLDLDLDDGKADILSTESANVIASGNYMLFNGGGATAGRNGLSVELTGSNRPAAPSAGKDAFGARVVVTAGGRTLTRQVLPTMGASRRLHFGLGTASSGTEIKIYWPENPVPQVLSGDPYINSVLRVVEP